MALWPTSNGDHRAARRGDGAGPAAGRVRWTWSAPAGAALRSPLVDRRGRIHVGCGPEVIVLDSNGTLRDRLLLPPESVLAAVVDEGLVAYEGRTLVCLDERGAVVWERTFDLAIRAVHVGPSGEVFVHTLEGRGFPVDGTVSRIGRGGAVVWTVPQAQSKVVGLAAAPQLAFDDDGVLFATVVARLGDGVSGADMQTGGLAAYDSASGRPRFVLGPAGWISQLHGLAHGAVVTGRTTRILDASGVTQTIDDADGRREQTLVLERPSLLSILGGRSLTVVRDERLADVPSLLQKNGPGSFVALDVVLDRAGGLYATTFAYDAAERRYLFALENGGALRWSLALPRGPGGTAIGLAADANLVVVHGKQVLAIE